MKLVFEYGKEGLSAAKIRIPNIKKYDLGSLKSKKELPIPDIAETDVVRHYSALADRAYGVDNGFYPLGSCTMKYNPKLNEYAANLTGFIAIHPLQPEDTAQGALKVMYELSGLLKEITGMDAVTLQPAAGAHGEYTGLCLIRAYHAARGDLKRNKIIVPDSAHGTNPASAVFAGFQVVNIKSDSQFGVDLDELKKACGEDTAALMLTNPTTLGLFEKNIKEISETVHNAGGLLYYDGANLNAVMGTVRPGDMGFDVVHVNLHKTFSTPHGGGGPGSGPVGCKAALSKFLPNPHVTFDGQKYHFTYGKESIGRVNSFYGNFGVLVRALAYIRTLGGDGLKNASETAVLNANYMKARLSDILPAVGGSRPCMHEFVLSLEKLKEETGVSALDFAKALIDRGMHPPTMYFPLTVHEALMFEPTETESKETLDNAVEIIRELYQKAYTDPSYFKGAPHTTPVSRPDEVLAARNPVLIYPLKTK